MLTTLKQSILLITCLTTAEQCDDDSPLNTVLFIVSTMSDFVVTAANNRCRKRTGQVIIYQGKTFHIDILPQLK